ncbi:hypothetical protein GW17_00049619 [Ensete ventricosum]|nr:hypothetical protein GW17_00049619 [Ensete ventricosum]
MYNILLALEGGLVSLKRLTLYADTGKHPNQVTCMHIPKLGLRAHALILFPANGNVSHKALGHSPPPSRDPARAGCNYLKATGVTLSTKANQVGRCGGCLLEVCREFVDRLTGAHGSSPEVARSSPEGCREFTKRSIDMPKNED